MLNRFRLGITAVLLGFVGILPMGAGGERPLWELYRDSGLDAESKRFYDLAALRYELALSSIPSEIKPLQLAQLLHHAANVYREQGDYPRAERHYDRSLAVYDQLLKELSHKSDFPSTEELIRALMDKSRVSLDIAMSYDYQDKPNAAELMYRKAIETWDLATLKSEPRKARRQELYGIWEAYAALARIYYTEEKYAEAEVLYNRLLTSEGSIDFPEVRAGWFDLQGRYAPGRYLDAERLYQQMVERVEQNEGPQHPKLAIVLDAYAWNLSRRNELAAAEELSAWARAIREEFGREARSARTEEERKYKIASALLAPLEFAQPVMVPLAGGGSRFTGGPDIIPIFCNAELANLSNPGPTLKIGFVTVMYLPNAKLVFYAAPPDPSCRAEANVLHHRQRHTLTALKTGKILLTGGTGRDVVGAVLLNTAQLYDPISRIIEPTGSMRTPRASHTATVLSDGRVLIAGGENRAGQPYISTEFYDPAKGEFTDGPTMVVPRSLHTATRLTNGTVLFTGGSPEGTAEIYSPVSGAFRTVGRMLSSRTGHSATLQPDGKVLITGGISMQGVPDALFSLELYDPATGHFTPMEAVFTDPGQRKITVVPKGDILFLGEGVQVPKK